MKSWKEFLTEALEYNGESFDSVVSCTLSEEELNRKFDHGFGGTCGEPFTLWTTNYVYFPVCYDGAEWVGSVPRHPNGEATNHHGGG